MAKVGLNFGDKLQIVDKSYRVIDGLDLTAVLGRTTYRTTEDNDVIYEDDLTQPRRPDGTYPQIPTGEIRGAVLGIHSGAQHETLFVTITDMLPSDIDGLGLKARDEVVLHDVVVTYSSVNGRDNYKLFASKIAKGNGSSVKGQAKENKETKD